MRALWIAFFAAAAMSPAMAQGFGGANEHSTTTSQTTTTTTKSGDTTTTTRSETSSHGAGFDFGSIFGGPSRHNEPSYSYDSLGGSWKIGEANGDKTCDLTLEKTKFISGYGARTGIGCPDELFGVGSWMLAGDEIRLIEVGGKVLAKLHPAGHDRWNGKTTAGLDIFMTKQ